HVRRQRRRHGAARVVAGRRAAAVGGRGLPPPVARHRAVRCTDDVLHPATRDRRPRPRRTRRTGRRLRPRQHRGRAPDGAGDQRARPPGACVLTGSLLLWVAIALVSGAGAGLRFLLDVAVQSSGPGRFPLGILVVNGLGSLLLGLLHGAGTAGDSLLLSGTALLGSFTTFSTWMVQSERLAEDGESSLALLNVAGSLTVG